MSHDVVAVAVTAGMLAGVMRQRPRLSGVPRPPLPAPLGGATCPRRWWSPPPPLPAPASSLGPTPAPWRCAPRVQRAPSSELRARCVGRGYRVPHSDPGS